MIVCRKCKSMKVQSRQWVQINTGEPFGDCDEGEDDKKFYWCSACEAHCFLEEQPENFKIDLLSPDGISMFDGKLYDTTEEAIYDFNEWKQRFIEQGYYSSNKGRIQILELYDHMIFKPVIPQQNGN